MGVFRPQDVLIPDPRRDPILVLGLCSKSDCSCRNCGTGKDRPLDARRDRDSDSRSSGSRRQVMDGESGYAGGSAQLLQGDVITRGPGEDPHE